MTPEEFEARWAALPQPISDTKFEASEVLANSGVWVARDFAERPHLLVRVPDDAALNAIGTRGLSAKIGIHRIEGHEANYIDLASLDSAVDDTFASVAAEVASVLTDTVADQRAGAVENLLSEWRWFWGVDASSMTSTDAIGLFGELWFLLRWAGVSAESIEAWGASNGARHDFQWTDRSVEVKVTSRAGPVVHTVQHLDQLANPETGELFLYSLKIVRDSLAANSLHSLVEAALSHLTHAPAVRADLLAKLGPRGYTRVGRGESAVQYRVLDEALYRVADGFPRLTEDTFPDGLPEAIVKVSYQLDMNTCADWCVARTPEGWPPH
jgi:hypothetical protein